MEKKDRLKFLMEQFHAGTANAAELAELTQLLNDPGATELLNELWENIPASAHFFDEGRTEAMLATIGERNRQAINLQQRGRTKRMAFSIAAAVLLLISTSIAYFYFNTPSKNIPATPVAQRDSLSLPVMPGGDKAVLVLADGSAIVLDSTANGAITAQGNVHVSKINGQVVYATATGSNTAPVLFNTLRTPRGGQYQLVLADGSKVWMNAGSSLRFPTSFPGKEREVVLSGEAYFEIAKDPQRPFRVKVNNMQVQVLGTHFNVMAYDNEITAAVTLLEGSVVVQRNNEHVKMRPGQQVQSGAETGLKLLNNVDMEETVAWKNGFFQFNHTSLPVLMRQLERWYNIDVVYLGKIPDRKFGGKIPRKSNLNEVQQILELSKVYTKTAGNKLIILEQ